MKKPNIKNYNPDPNYIRGLILESGLSQRKVAEILGINERTIRYYCSQESNRTECPYPVQYCIEALADKSLE